MLHLVTDVKRQSPPDNRRTANSIAPTAQQADQRGFPQDDKLYQIALRTDQDLRHLCMELHYLSCKSGVGREKKE